MKIFPAIDLVGGKAVRLTQGDYNKMTVYSDNPVAVAQSFAADGAEYLHTVDLEGARDGGCPNFGTVKDIIDNSGLAVEIGGGIRSLSTVEAYLTAGAFRVILGTAALRDPVFLRTAVENYGEKVAVGVDLRDGLVAVRGWTEITDKSGFDFISELAGSGVKSFICTDISKDGALSGTNEPLYRELVSRFPNLKITASGGISDISIVTRLALAGVWGAILGKAIYTGDISLKAALKAAEVKL